MPYWLTNPDHGVMPVYDLSDVERNKAYGWTLLNQGPAPVIQVPGGLVVPAVPGHSMEFVAAEPAAKRRGRPPKVK